MIKIYTKTETGVMIIRDGLAFDIDYQDGQITSYGWIDPSEAKIHDPKYCKKPGDAVRPNERREAERGKLIPVVRTTKTEFVS